jgi:hypothetical protein
MSKGIFSTHVFPVACVLRDVPCKVRVIRGRIRGRRCGHGPLTPLEKPTPNWTRLQKHIEAQLKAGGAVELTHRRLDPPVPAKRKGPLVTPRDIPGTWIIETVDVRFSRGD